MIDKKTTTKEERINDFNERMKNNKYHQGDIYYAMMDNYDEEENNGIQQGARPVMIVSSDVNNIYSSVVHVVPLTTKNKNFKLHLHRNGHKDYYCPEQLQIIPKENISLEIVQHSSDNELAKVLDLFQVHLGTNTLDNFRNKWKGHNHNKVKMEDIKNDCRQG